MSKHSVSADFLTTALPGKAEGAGSVRDALRAWLPRRSGGDVSGAGLDEALSEHCAKEIASAFENRARLLRENARAAFRSVEGAHGLDGCDRAAVEAALDVVMAAWRSAAEARDAHAETLKAIRLYAPDPRSRALAAASLAGEAPCRTGVPILDAYES